MVEGIVHFQSLSSVRNRSVIDVSFWMFMSQTFHPGSSRMLRPALPKRGCPAASAASMYWVVKQLVSNQWSTVRIAGLPIADAVGALDQRTCSSQVTTGDDTEGKSRLEEGQPRNLPAADQLIRDPTRAQEAFPRTEGSS